MNTFRILLGVVLSLLSLIYLVVADPNLSWQIVHTVRQYSACMIQHWQRDPLPLREPTGVTLTLKADHLMLPLDRALDFGLQTGEAGYISLWNVGASGRVTRLYPADGEFVISTQRWQRTAADLGLLLRTGYPAGSDAVAVLWTRRPPPILQAEYPSVVAYTTALEPLQARASSDWGLVEATYCVVSM